MAQIVEFLTSNAIEILTGVLVLTTAVYAWLTYKIAKSNNDMVNEVRKQIELQKRPIITINTEVHHHAMFLMRIWNSGNSPAENITFSIDKDVYRYGHGVPENNIRELYIFKEGLAALAPKDGYWIDIGTASDVGTIRDGKTLVPEKFSITVNYSFDTTPYSETFIIDLKSYFFTSGEKRTAEQIEKIAKSLDELVRTRRMQN